MENHLPCAPSAQAAPRGNRKHLGRDAGRARPTASRVHNPYKLTPVAENEAPASDDPDLRDLTHILKQRGEGVLASLPDVAGCRSAPGGSPGPALLSLECSGCPNRSDTAGRHAPSWKPPEMELV